MLYNLLQFLKSQKLPAQISSEGQNARFLASRMFAFHEVHELYTIRWFVMECNTWVTWWGRLWMQPTLWHSLITPTPLLLVCSPLTCTPLLHPLCWSCNNNGPRSSICLIRSSCGAGSRAMKSIVSSTFRLNSATLSLHWKDWSGKRSHPSNTSLPIFWSLGRRVNCTSVRWCADLTSC